MRKKIFSAKRFCFHPCRMPTLGKQAARETFQLQSIQAAPGPFGWVVRGSRRSLQLCDGGNRTDSGTTTTVTSARKDQRICSWLNVVSVDAGRTVRRGPRSGFRPTGWLPLPAAAPSEARGPLRPSRRISARKLKGKNKPKGEAGGRSANRSNSSTCRAGGGQSLHRATEGRGGDVGRVTCGRGRAGFGGKGRPHGYREMKEGDEAGRCRRGRVRLGEQRAGDPAAGMLMNWGGGRTGGAKGCSDLSRTRTEFRSKRNFARPAESERVSQTA